MSRDFKPRVTSVAITLQDNSAPEIIRITVVSPNGQEAIFFCLWDNMTDSLSGPWATRESVPSRLNIS